MIFTRWRSWGWQLGLLSCSAMSGVLTASGDCILAQITSDNTLGTERSVVTPNVDINGIPSDRIDSGAIRGANLFHSFQEFNISEGRGAYFTNPVGIQNILSRVTGGNPSKILGKLGVLGNANLFLINPSGIIFGKNASLDIGGSFVGTTANSLNFADGNHFSAHASQTTPLLTVSIPLGLQFGTNPGKILVQGDGQGLRSTTELIDTNVGLRVQPNQTLALVGGSIALEGGTLKTAGGRIELGSMAAPGLVSLTPTDSGWVLGYESSPNYPSGSLSDYGNIDLSDAAAVDASGAGGGDIHVRGKRVRLANGSQIESSTLGLEPGGTLSVIASELVELTGGSADGQYPSSLYASVYERATGSGSNLNVETGQLVVRDGAAIFVATYGGGAAGTLVVKARESLAVLGTSAEGYLPSALLTAVQRGATGAGGNLSLEIGRLIIRDGAQIATGTYGAGAAGTLAVKARESVELSDTSVDGQLPSLLSAEAAEDTGNAGNLTIETGQLTIRNGAEVSVRSISQGKAGKLTVQARNLLLENQGAITGTTTQGHGGDITLQLQDLLLLHRNSRISTTAGGTTQGGDGGNINIDTDFIVTVPSENNDITANAFTGRGGNVQITAQSIFGSQFQEQQTPQSDITASSEFGVNGTVEINTPTINPSYGLINLPTVPGEAEVVQACQPYGSQEQSEFVVTGHGGLPSSPSDPLNSDAVWIDLDSTIKVAENHPSSKEPTQVTKSTTEPLVEATKWTINNKGEVILTASTPTNTPNNSDLPTANCYLP